MFLLGAALGMALASFIAVAFHPARAEHKDSIVVEPKVCLTAAVISLQNMDKDMVGYGIGRSGPLVMLLVAPNGDFSIIFRHPKDFHEKLCYLVTGEDWYTP